MHIQHASNSYEDWLGKQITIVSDDLELKHTEMAKGAFEFLRATFYRFIQIWKDTAGEAAHAPKVLAVGDLHVANFGTWRDVEGRLVWGINDFDEAYPLPYTADLVRLATSAHIATEENHLAIAAADACESILSGYAEALAIGGKPFILAEEHRWLRDTVTGDLRNPVEFWGKLTQLKDHPMQAPHDALHGIEKLLPDGAKVEKIVHRVAGLGSLGRERYVALGSYCGANIAREAKALCASASVWAGWNGGDENGPMYEEVLKKAVRAQDPFVRIRSKWIVRRLAPYCSRVDLASLPKQREESRLLHAMGWETANVHLGTHGAGEAILTDLKKRPSKWLHKAAGLMKETTYRDFEEWGRKSKLQGSS